MLPNSSNPDPGDKPLPPLGSSKPQGGSPELGSPSEDFISSVKTEATEPRKNKRPLKFVVAGVVLILIGGGAFIGLKSGEDSTITIPRAEIPTETTEADDNEIWYLDQDPWVYPTSSELKTPAAFTFDFDSDLNSELVKQVSNTDLHRVAGGVLPTESKGGYTSKLEESRSAIDLPNPRFTLWSNERFEAESTYIANMLLNPVFGGWEEYQYSSLGAFDAPAGDAFPFFTERFASRLNAGEDRLPIFADWEKNDYGMDGELLPNNAYSDPFPRWLGKITQAKVKFTSTDLLSPKATATYAVRFEALTATGKNSVKTGTLTVSYVAAPDLASDEEFRLRVDNASLKVK